MLYNPASFALLFAGLALLVQADPVNIIGRTGPTTTVTRTVTTTRTVTATPVCTSPPPATTSSVILKFDDITCPGICPGPSDYQGFHFDGASGWQIVSRSALSTDRNEYLAVTSQPNALMTQSSGFVDFGVLPSAGFTFDVVRFEWSVFSNNAETDVIFFMNGTTVGGAKRSYSTHVTSGINIAPYEIDLTSPPGQALDFKNLVNIAFAAYTSYDPATKTGMPATIIFDDFSFTKTSR